MPKSKSILVADDDEMLRAAICAALEGVAAVDQAADGEACLRAVGVRAPDLIILDLMMPGLSGAETLHRLQKDPQTRAIPIVIITAFNLSDAQEAELKREPGVRALLRKPFSMEILRRAASEAVGATPAH